MQDGFLKIQWFNVCTCSGATKYYLQRHIAYQLLICLCHLNTEINLLKELDQLDLLMQKCTREHTNFTSSSACTSSILPLVPFGWADHVRPLGSRRNSVFQCRMNQSGRLQAIMWCPCIKNVSYEYKTRPWIQTLPKAYNF